MAIVVSSSSPSQSEKNSSVKMESHSPAASPTADDRFWADFRSRVDAIAERRKRKSLHNAVFNGSEREDWLREERLLLLQGFDSVASSLSLLTQNIDASVQDASNLAKPPLTEIFKVQCNSKFEVDNKEEVEEDNRKQKRHCGETATSADDQSVGNNSTCASIATNETLKRAHDLVVSMANKASSLSKEVKSIKMDLCFMQERCLLLEEENKRLREGLPNGSRQEEDDMVRLQLEALLAEKSRLANENAHLTRENQCLQQLVEYHQMTSQHLSGSYEDDATIGGGTLLDFSSCKHEDDDELGGGPQTPRFGIFKFPNFGDAGSEDEQEVGIE